MNEERQKLIHLHSNEIVNEEGKIPSSGSVEYGEIAVGYAEGHERLFIKNDADEMVSFSPDYKLQELSGNVIDNERVVAASLNDLNHRFSGYTEKSEFSAHASDTTIHVTTAEKEEWSGKQDAIEDLSDIRNNALSGASAYTALPAIEQSIEDVDDKVDALSGSVIENEEVVAETLNDLNDRISSVEEDYLPKSTIYFDGAEYNSEDKKIYFKKGNTIISAATIDATDFIKDGMVSNVEITEGTGAHAGEQVLKITFNTDAGQSPIEIPLTDIFDPSNYYSKDDIDNMHLINETTFSEHTGDTTIHVTTAEKEEWSGKQDVINDLSDIRNNALSGASAYTALADIEESIEDVDNRVTELSGNVIDNEEVIANVLNNFDERIENCASASDLSTHTGNTTIHVTSEDKSTWNGKQDAINDLSTIRSNAESGASAYNMVTAHTADTTIHVTTQDKEIWSGKQDAIEDLTTIRNNALSGASAYTALADIEESIEDVDDRVTELSGNVIDNEEVIANVLNEFNERFEEIEGDIESIPTPGTLTTTATTSQSTAVNESLAGSIVLHKVAKTGNYTDLLNAPTSNTAFTNDAGYVTTAETKTQIESYDYLPKSDTYFDGAEYNSTDKKIYFKKGNTIITASTIDATDFIKDGMVSNVEITSGTGAHAGEQVLKITFNTDAGQSPIEIPLTDIFDPSNYYTKDDIDNMDLINETDFSAHTGDTDIHVTTQDKSTWNGKQDAINDLSTIRDNAASGASAYSEVTAHTADTTVHVTAQDKSTWSGKQDAINDLSTIRDNAASGASAYTAVTAHTADTTVHLPSVTSADNGKILSVVNGAWALITPQAVYSGSGQPQQSLGTDGDIYLQTD